MLPFIIKLSDEYIENIIQLIFDNLNNFDKKFIKQFCYNNAQNLIKGYARMISYWDAYYREDCPDISHYIGYKLYHECLFIDDLLKLQK